MYNILLQIFWKCNILYSRTCNGCKNFRQKLENMIVKNFIFTNKIDIIIKKKLKLYFYTYIKLTIFNLKKNDILLKILIFFYSISYKI